MEMYLGVCVRVRVNTLKLKSIMVISFFFFSPQISNSVHNLLSPFKMYQKYCAFDANCWFFFFFFFFCDSAFSEISNREKGSTHYG